MSHLATKFRLVTIVLGILSLGAATAACGSYQVQATPGNCSTDRHWVPASQNADGTWVEGYCEWDEGRGPNDPRW